MSLKSDHASKWVGRYKGVRFEIIERDMYCWPTKPDISLWCSYIIISDENQPKTVNKLWDKIAVNKKRYSNRIYTLYETDFFDDMPWNYGVTFCEAYTMLGGSRHIKVGDDYGHAWDIDNMNRGEAYDFDKIESDIIKKIDYFIENISLDE